MAINLTDLFEVQRKLDAEIESKHPTAPGEDRLAKRILALQVELGECANEWRGFKFWSKDQSARTSPYMCKVCDEYKVGGLHTDNPLLEEYVDCLHFILSIGIQLGFEKRTINRIKTLPQDSVTDQFIEVTNDVTELYYAMDFQGLRNLISSFIDLGEMLGFTWEKVTDAYMSKNKKNWDRQANGY